MKFAESGYYIESYSKCDNCGVLLYDDGIKPADEALSELVFCTQWCVAWHAQKAAGVEVPQVDLPFD